MPKLIDLTGQEFGRLTVVKHSGKTKHGHHQWECLCCCGNTTIVTGVNLKRKSRKTESCGCLYKESRKTCNLQHGGVGTLEYIAWTSMRDRVKRVKGWNHLTIDPRWENFSNFREDMGVLPGKGYTIDRRDNSLGYSPENCYWATSSQQNRNKRNARLLTYKGKTQNLIAWSEELGIKRTTLQQRIDAHGWSVEEALSTPTLSRKKS